MITWPKALVREIADRRVLLFVGAGVSKTARSSMPTWPELLDKLKENLKTKSDKALIKQLINQNRLLDAAQIITDGTDRADLNAILRATFQIRPPPIHDIYKSILRLDVKTIVTTNYDEFLEKNFDTHSGGNTAYNVCKHTSKELLNQVRSPTRTIAKIHGCITEPDDLVLDRMSFFTARQHNIGYFSVMSSLFTTSTVLFIGYSLGDPDLQIILENINSISYSSSGHYSLISKLDHKSIAKAIKKSYNINCIEYPSGAHSMVPEYISILADAVEESRASRGSS